MSTLRIRSFPRGWGKRLHQDGAPAVEIETLVEVQKDQPFRPLRGVASRAVPRQLPEAPAIGNVSNKVIMARRLGADRQRQRQA